MSKILIVEDENMLLDMMRAYLGAQGYETAGVKSYDEALDLAYESNFDLWIFDVKIIGGSGFALLRELREAGKTLLLTTHYMEEAERLCGRIAFLRAGRLRALDTAAGIRAAAGDAKDLEQAFLRLSHEEECS